MNTDIDKKNTGRPNGSTRHETAQSWQPFPVPPDLSGASVYVGTSGYYYDDWIGVFNPPKRSAKKLGNATEQERSDQDRLRFYQRYFSFVEINHTFYQEPQRGHMADIEARSKEGMRYAVKVHREISHSRDCDARKGQEIMQRYIAATGPLIENGRLFGFLIQLEDRWYRTGQRLDYLLSVAQEAVARRLDVHIEFRHASWHAAPVLQALKDAGVGICNTDIPPIRHAFPLRAYATTDKGYVRYSGRNLESWYPSARAATSAARIAARNARYDYRYSEQELEQLVQGQLTLMKKTGSMAVAYNNHYQAKAIANAIDNINRLKRFLETMNRG
ncbi:MAG: DUF72 domain-containing protein [Chitinispirillaceae bacterium]|nr:DUF72 domain-containing protein [Chitinispirillaceae bacterium]